MAPGVRQKLSVPQLLMVAVVSLAALLAVFIVVPLITDAAGLYERHANYAVAGAAFLIALAAARWVKSLTRKFPERK